MRKQTKPRVWAARDRNVQGETSSSGEGLTAAEPYESVLNNSRASLPMEGSSNGKELQLANPRPSCSGGTSMEVSPSVKKEIVVFYFHNVVSTTLDA